MTLEHDPFLTPTHRLPSTEESPRANLSASRDDGKDLAGDLSALCDGAAMLSRAGNRVAALALLWAAVGLDPLHLAAHRRLAATLANVGDVEAAADEYIRYMEFVLKLGDVRRAAIEFQYARATLGEHPMLEEAGHRLIPLAAIVSEASQPERVARGAEHREAREARTTHIPRRFVAAGILAHLARRASGIVQQESLPTRTVGQATMIGGILFVGLSIIAIGAILAFAAVRPF